jgi:hypothetical protein
MNLLVSNPLSSNPQSDKLGFLQVLGGSSEQSEQSANSSAQEDSQHTTQGTLGQEPATAGTSLVSGKAAFHSTEGEFEWTGNPETPATTVLAARIAAVVVSSVNNAQATTKLSTMGKEAPARGRVPESPTPVAAPEAGEDPASTANQASAILEGANSVGLSFNPVSTATLARQPIIPATTDDTNAASQKSLESSDAKAAGPAAQSSTSLESQQNDPTGTTAQAGSAVQVLAQAAISASAVPIFQPDNHVAAFHTAQASGADIASSAKNAAEPYASTPSNPAAEKSTQASPVVHATTSENQPLQHAQADASQAAAVAPGRLVEGDAAHVQAVAMPAADRDSAPSAHRFEGAAGSSRLPEQPADSQATDQTASMGINAAKVIQTMNQSEMHVGMHSADFGEISIRTSVSQQHMTAEISVDHTELGKAISAHIPAMREKLGDMGLRAAVVVSQGPGSSSGGSPESSSKEQRPAVSAAHARSEVVSSTPELSTLPVAASTVQKNRLDIRA